MADPFASDIQKTEQSEDSEVSISKKSVENQFAPPPPPPFPQLQPQAINVQAIPPPIIPPQPRGSHRCLKATLIGIEVLCFIGTCFQAYYHPYASIAILLNLISLGLFILAFFRPPMPYAYLVACNLEILHAFICLMSSIFFVYIIVHIGEYDTAQLGITLWILLLVSCIINTVLYLIQAIITYILWYKRA